MLIDVKAVPINRLRPVESKLKSTIQIRRCSSIHRLDA